MTHVLDSGGLSRLVAARALIAALRQRELWPPEVPAVVLVECLTGDHRRGHAVNRLVSMCMVRPVDEPMARRAAALRTRDVLPGRMTLERIARPVEVDVVR